MKVKSVLIICGFLAVTATMSAQKKWALRDCIDYARQENIQVKKMQLSVESYDVDVEQSKAELFPSLSGSLSQGYSHSKDAMNDYKYKGVFNGQYGLNASWTVYNGNRNRNAIKQSELEKEAGKLEVEEQKNNMETSITQVYLQILYARESIKNNENILESSKQQLKQSQDFLDAGTIAMAEFAQVESQYTTNKYNLVLAQNSYDNYKLQLKQLLELDIDEEIDIEYPEIGDNEVIALIPSVNEVYQTALAIRPEVKSSKLNIDVSEISRSTAKAGYLPSVALNGSLGTSNAWSSGPSVTTQFNRNFNQYVGLSVSVPIFDNRKNKSTVQKSQIQIESAQLDLLNTQKELLRTIEGLYQDAVSAQSKYMAAKDKQKSSELSYQLVKDSYTLGMRNTVELVTEQNSYANALQDMLQAKYSALLNRKLLEFYQGKEITL